MTRSERLLRIAAVVSDERAETHESQWNVFGFAPGGVVKARYRVSQGKMVLGFVAKAGLRRAEEVWFVSERQAQQRWEYEFFVRHSGGRRATLAVAL